jgi:hypothetical protein
MSNCNIRDLLFVSLCLPELELLEVDLLFVIWELESCALSFIKDLVVLKHDPATVCASDY